MMATSLIIPARPRLWAPPARRPILSAPVRRLTIPELIAMAVGPLRKNADGKLLKLSSGKLMKDCCCGEAGTCEECGFCLGCDAEDRPGCPTADCCTPNRIQVVVTNVDAAICDCFKVAGLFGDVPNRAKLVNPPAIDGTFTLTQSVGSPCTWEHVVDVDPGPYVDIYNTDGCVGTRIGGSDESSQIFYTLVRSGATTWSFQIHDSFGNTYFGANGAQCGDGIAATAVGTEADCKNIPDQDNEIAVCCLDENTLRSCLSTAGNATFTACP